MDLEQKFEEIMRRVFREELQAATLEDRLLTAEQVAEMLSYTDVGSVYRLKREKKLRAIPFGEKSIRFKRSEVLRYIDELAS